MHGITGYEVIKSFRHKGLERFFVKDDARGVPAKSLPRIERMLDRLDTCRKADDMNLPGYRFHALKGEMKGRFAVSVSDDLRITYEMDGEDAAHVDLEDYH